MNIIESIRHAINDSTAKFITDSQLKGIILKHTIGQEQTWTFTRKGSGIYKFGDGPLYLWNPTYAEDTSVSPIPDYTFHFTGILEGAGDSRTSISVTGLQIDYNNIMAEILCWLATNKAREIAQSNEAGSFSPNTVRAELMKQASVWRGFYGF